MTPGTSRRASAITPAGIVLSHPTSTTTASNRLPRATSSMESAITSRLMSDMRIPSEPIVMPSEIDTVLNSSGAPPASRMPALTCPASSPQVVVAGADLDPGVRDADERAVEVLVGHARGAQHRARRRTALAVGQRAAAPLQRVGRHVREILQQDGPVSPGPSYCARTGAITKINYSTNIIRFAYRLPLASSPV